MYQFPRHKTLIVFHYAIEAWKAVHWLFKLLVVFKNTSIVRLQQRWIKFKRTTDSNRTWSNCSVVSGRDNESRAEFLSTVISRVIIANGTIHVFVLKFNKP